VLPKLIRDRIPEIIKESGKNPKYRKAPPSELNYLLIEKMKEELYEFKETPCLDEAADMYEVFLAILENWKLKLSDVKNVANIKKDIRGSFKQGIVLDEIIISSSER
jgi:predicted house-cleaning noncanonical NTP pyrophosphatase (MazG superfamily)